MKIMKLYRLDWIEFFWCFPSFVIFWLSFVISWYLRLLQRFSLKDLGRLSRE